MTRVRTRRAALAAVAVLAVAAAVAPQPWAAGGGGGGRGLHVEPSAKIRAMVGEVSADQLHTFDAGLVSFGNRNTLSTQTDPNFGIGAARDYIYHQFQHIAATSGGRMTVELQSYTQEPDGDRIPTPTVITNVVATLRGTQSPDRYYVVSGHYDSRCTDVLDTTCLAPGADDDASGVSLVMEMARVMATRSFDATIVFMAVAGEEQNLYGSNHYAQVAKANGLNIAGMFTNDIVGSPNGAPPDVVRLFSQGVPDDETPAEAALRQAVGGEDDGPARQLGRYAKEVADNAATGMHIELIFRRDRYLRGGDNISFLDNGYRAAARFTEIREDFKHQHQDVRVEDGKQFGDLIQFVDFGYLAGVTKVNVATFASLADAPAQPANVKIVATRLTNDTTLTWNANTEPDIDHYEVVWRQTTEPVWTAFKNVGNVTTATLPRSKDNFFFGVRAVDKDGNKSPVTFPTPQF
jgi:hypothetical protein